MTKHISHLLIAINNKFGICTQTVLIKTKRNNENGFVAGSLESANWSILAAHNLFKEVVRKKSGFYVNEIFKSQ